MADISEIILPNNAVYNIKDAYTRLQFSSNGNANRANSILYGKVDDTSTATAYTATIEGLDELVDGTTIMLHNGVVTSASGFTININDLGAKPCYNNMTNATRETTIFNIAYTMLFVYSTDLNDGNGGWWIYRGYDANTNTIGYQLRSNSSNKVASDTGYKYRLWLTSADGSKWVPINTSSSTNATTTRTLNTRPIDPFGPIVYRATNGTCNAGSGVGATGIWQQYTVTIGYSYMASGFSLSFPDSVYLRCTPQADGSAIMQDIVQALPTTKDGKIYIHLGTAYSATAMELTIEHPVYWHDGTGIRLWTGVAVPTKTSDLTNDSGFITSTDIPEGSAASTTSPKMDGTAAVGTEMAFARGDHVHPTDTSRQAELISGTNIKTINNQSILGSGDLAIQEGTEMVVLKYGISTWADFEAAYPNAVVYCRASSNSNPASGAQTRMAFMAYVNNETAPTNVEFQYYRSVSTKTASQQGDQVYVYKLDKTTGWSVIVREAKIKIATGAGLTESFASNTLTLSREDELPAVTASDNGKVLTVSNGDWAAVTPGTSVNGVKGDAESTYRTGNVNLTPANLGITDFIGATDSTAGAGGLVPAPSAQQQKALLLGDGGWHIPATSVSANASDDTLTVNLLDSPSSAIATFTLWPATESQPGLMSTENVVALNGKADASDLNNYLPLSGGTLTGDLTIKDNNIDITITPSSSQYNGMFEILDSNDKQIMNITAVHSTNNYHGLSIGVYDPDTGQQNALQLTQNNNDNYRVWISQPAAWRSALSIGTIGTKDTLTESDIPNIAASKIDSGTLAITYGGTGKTTATEAWTALGGGAIGKKATLSSADIPDNAADTSGNAGTATKLATARSLYVALGTAYNSSSPVTFDGSAAKALPVNGTLAIAHGGTGKTTATEAWTALGGGAIGKKASLTASDIPSLAASKITTGTLAIARGGNGVAVGVKIAENTAKTLTVYQQGRVVTVVAHGVSATPGATTTLLTINRLEGYPEVKPAYNVSTLVTDTSANTRIARLWVDASTGGIKLAAAGYTSSSTWYGTLTYIATV